MFIIVDSREIVTAGYASAFDREGYASLELHPSELLDWLEITCAQDLGSVDASFWESVKKDAATLHRSEAGVRKPRSWLWKIPPTLRARSTCFPQAWTMF